MRSDKGKAKKAQYDMKFHREHYSRFVMDLKPEMRERWTEAAKKEGKTLTAFVRDCVNDYIAKKEERGE